MNTILILSILLTIVSMTMYYLSRKESVSLKQKNVGLEEKVKDMNALALNDINIIQEKDETITTQRQGLLELQRNIGEKDKLIDECRAKLEDIKAEMQAHENKFAEFQQMVLENENTQIRTHTGLFEPVFIDEANINFKGEIETNRLLINSSLLIGDNRLFDVLKRLINSKLLPDSITEKSGLNVRDLSITVWTQKFTEEGDYERCMTWREIMQEMMDKKNLITDYLNNVIQESNRAMVVHSALTEKNTKEEVVS